MSSINELNRRFGIGTAVVFSEGPGGLAMVSVQNELASAKVMLQGAHLTEWSPNGQQPVIWLSQDAKFAPGKSIRGGAPVCWPWFGPHESNSSFPAHGFARTVDWEVIETSQLAGGQTRLVFRLIPTDATRAQWPHDTVVENHITVGKTLEIDLVTFNRGNEPVTIGQAMHTYFAVGDIGQVTIEGLDGCPYLDKVEGFARKLQQGPIAFSGETDRIYLDATSDAVIEDQALARKIRISKRGSSSTVVWTPWQDKAAAMGDLGLEGWRRMVCVENANAASDVVSIAAKGEHHLWVSYSVE